MANLPKPGRAPRSDGVATRQRILDRAGEAIAAASFAATSNKQIAAAAGVNLATINHHFGNRDGLYQSVLVEAHRRLIDASDLELVLASAETPEARLKELLRFLLRGTATAQRWPLIVLAREIMSPSPHLLALQQMEVLPKINMILPILGELTQLPQDDPRLLLIVPMIAAPCALVTIAGQVASPLTDRIATLSEEDAVETILTLVSGGMAAIRSTRGS